MMIPFLIKHKNLIVGLGAFLLLTGLLWWKDYQIDSLEQKLAVAQTSIASYEESLAVLQADSRAKIQALEVESSRQLIRTRNMERLLGRIEGAGNEQDAPVAPVLRDTVERLYGHTADQD